MNLERLPLFLARRPRTPKAPQNRLVLASQVLIPVIDKWCKDPDLSVTDDQELDCLRPIANGSLQSRIVLFGRYCPKWEFPKIRALM